MTTMIDPLRRAVRAAPDAVAARCGDVEITYAQTWDRARRLVGALRELGVRDGDRVAVVGRNCHRYLELYQAVPGAGMALVPLNQRHTAAELAYALTTPARRVLFVGRGHRLSSRGRGARHRPRGRIRGAAGRGAGRPSSPTSCSADTMAGLFYTGGTTGAAKGVILTHRNLVANAFHFQAQFAFRPDTCWLVAAPLFHAAGSIAVLATVWHGGCQVMLPVFDPAAALDLIETPPGHGDAAGADDARRARRRAAGPAPRRLQPAPAQPRRLPGRHRDPAPRPPAFPARRADAPVRDHRDRADRDDHGPRGDAARHTAGALLRAAGDRRRRSACSTTRPAARRPRAPSARC